MKKLTLIILFFGFVTFASVGIVSAIVSAGTILGIISSGTWQGDIIAHEYGGLELNVSGIGTGDILAGASSGTIEIVDGGASSDGDLLTIQADGTANWETPTGGSGSADVKSGTMASITEGSTLSVTFTSSFTGTPQCVVSFNDGSTQLSVAQVESEATTGFTIRILKIGGGGNSNRGVGWICTDAGN